MLRTDNKVHLSDTVIYVTPSRGYHLSAIINGVDVSLLLDTGALLRKDTWSQFTTNKPLPLRPWLAVELVSAGGTALTVHGCVSIDLELGVRYRHCGGQPSGNSGP